MNIGGNDDRNGTADVQYMKDRLEGEYMKDRLEGATGPAGLLFALRTTLGF
jgi:hypothetical protein